MELDPTRQIQSISKFRSETDAVLNMLSDQKTIVLTQHGKACAILVDPKDYEKQLDKLRLAEKLIKAEREIAEGKGRSHAEVVRLAKDWI